MTEKRFTLSKDTEWWFVEDNTIQVNEYGYRDDVTGEDKYRGLKQDLTEQETVDLLNELLEKNIELSTKCSQLEKENEQLRQQLIEKERMLDVRDKIIADVSKAINGDME